MQDPHDGEPANLVVQHGGKLRHGNEESDIRGSADPGVSVPSAKIVTGFASYRTVVPTSRFQHPQSSAACQSVRATGPPIHQCTTRSGRPRSPFVPNRACSLRRRSRYLRFPAAIFPAKTSYDAIFTDAEITVALFSLHRCLAGPVDGLINAGRRLVSVARYSA